MQSSTPEVPRQVEDERGSTPEASRQAEDERSSTPEAPKTEDAPLTPEQIQKVKSYIYEKIDEQKVADLFKIFDRDGSGKISAVELQTVMSAIDKLTVPKSGV